MSTGKRLLKMLLPLKCWSMLAVLLGLVTIACGIGLLSTSAYLISAAALHPSIEVLSVAVVGVRFFGISRGVFRYLERYVSHQVTFRMLSRIRTWFYRALEPLAPACLQLLQKGERIAFSSGDLLSRAVSDIESLQNFYTRVLAPPLVALLVGVLMWFFLDAFAVSLSLVWLVCFVMVGVVVPLLTYLLSRALGQEIVETRAALNVLAVDGLQGLADVLAFGYERELEHRFAALNRRLIALQQRMALINGVQSGLGTLFINGMLWVMFLVALPLVRSGHLNGLYLAVILLGGLASSEAVIALPEAFQELGGSLKAAQRLFEIVDAEPLVKPGPKKSPTPRGYTLDVQHLRFRYDKDEPYALDDLSFTLPEGCCLGIVGASGAGKSTLANLLLRFWDYQEGQIQLGGYNLLDYQPEDLHRLVSVVSQDTHLFTTSIRENLILARPEATDAELIQATTDAGFHTFIQTLPQGYRTLVGEQGLRLSGGERQRLAIARALLKAAPILLLDEVTANLDPLKEQEVMQSLRRLIKGRTTVLITHRFPLLELADEILVLQEGRIVERGQRLELMQCEGVYWRSWQQQQALPASCG